MKQPPSQAHAIHSIPSEESKAATSEMNTRRLVRAFERTARTVSSADRASSCTSSSERRTALVLRPCDDMESGDRFF
jgi:3-polyprenyl-4-hydroxybenzoate decarboxylase